MRASQPTAAAKSGDSAHSQTQTASGGVGESIASAVFKSGFGLAPLVTGLISLFGGGDSEAPAPLVKYTLPAAVQFEAARTGAGVTGLDYDQSGMPRSYAPAGGAQSSSSGPANETSAPAALQAPTPQITVNVQAMDARSFLDRSGDIALAVRDAMLNLNAINDVVNDL